MPRPPRPVFGFDVTGLPGYRVEESRAPGGGYLAIVKAGTVAFLRYNEATGQHDIPYAMDTDFSVELRSTCKGAVAAAHAHAAIVRGKTREA